MSHKSTFNCLNADNSKEYSNDKLQLLLIPFIIGTNANSFDFPIISFTDDSMIIEKNIISGRDISEDDYINHKRVVVVSDLYAKIVFGDENPIGQKISFILNTDGYSELFTVIGVYADDAKILQEIAQKDSSEISNLSQYVFIPNTVISENDLFDLSFQKAIITTSNSSESEKIRAFITANSSLNVYSYESNMKNVDDASRNLKQLLNIAMLVIIIITGISLLNNLVFSIRERTVEIGIKKSMGAEGFDICLQFFTEGLLIGIFGFIFGLIISILGMIILQIVLFAFARSSFLIFINPNAILSTFLFVLFQSIFFNIIPALYAAKIKVVEAIRFD